MTLRGPSKTVIVEPVEAPAAVPAPAAPAPPAREPAPRTEPQPRPPEPAKA